MEAEELANMDGTKHLSKLHSYSHPEMASQLVRFLKTTLDEILLGRCLGRMCVLELP